MKIALPDFVAVSSDVTDVAHQVTQAITDDLRSTGRFMLVDPPSSLTTEIDRPPQFGAWRALGVDGLVIGGVKAVADDRLRAQFRLWDVVAETQLRGAQYFAGPERWRQLGHVIAGSVYEQLAGEERDFESQRD